MPEETESLEKSLADYKSKVDSDIKLKLELEKDLIFAARTSWDRFMSKPDRSTK